LRERGDFRRRVSLVSVQAEIAPSHGIEDQEQHIGCVRGGGREVCNAKLFTCAFETHGSCHGQYQKQHHRRRCFSHYKPETIHATSNPDGHLDSETSGQKHYGKRVQAQSHVQNNGITRGGGEDGDGNPDAQSAAVMF
jgi:hypothetical protein